MKNLLPFRPALWLLLLLPFLWSCETDNFPDSIPEGEIWATVEGSGGTVTFRFDNSTTLPSLSNGYNANSRFLSMRREASTGFNYGVMQIIVTGLNLDEVSAPTDLSGVSLTFNSAPNTAFSGTGDEVNLQLTNIEGDVLRGTFSGTVRNTDNPSERLQIRNGQFHIRVIRE